MEIIEGISPSSLQQMTDHELQEFYEKSVRVNTLYGTQVSLFETNIAREELKRRLRLRPIIYEIPFNHNLHRN